MTTRWPAELPIPLRWQVASLLLPLTLLVGLSIHLVRAPAPPPLKVAADSQDRRLGLTRDERMAVYADIASHDAEWKGLASRFGDEWSRHDDYHIHVSRHIHYLAALRKIPLQSVFLIYDEGLRRHWPDPAGRVLDATWVPLQPRTQ